MNPIRLLCRKWVVLAMGLGLFALLIISTLNLNNPNLWFDEAGQFFISKGLNHGSEPFSKSQGISDVVYNNARFNFDPGGFSILLHYWSKVSNSHIWLRIFPFSFFLLTVFMFFKLGRLWFKETKYALLLAMIPLSYGLMIKMSFFIRGYSLEYLGVLVGIYFLFKLNERSSNKILIITSLLFCVFVCSRYSSVLYFAILDLCIWYFLYPKYSNKTKWLAKFFLFITPQVLVVGLIYTFSLSIQNTELEPLEHLRYLGESPKAIIMFPNVLFLTVVILMPLVYYYFDKEQRKGLAPLFWLATIVNLTFLCFSFFNLLPWEPFKRWGFPITLPVIMFYAYVLYYLQQGFKVKLKNAIIILIYTLLFSYDLPRVVKKTHLPQTEANFKLLKPNLNLKIFVENREGPSVRYLFEYGALKESSKFNYPEDFTFQENYPHNSREVNSKVSTNTHMKHNLWIGWTLDKFQYLDYWKPLPGMLNFYIPKDSLGLYYQKY